MRQGPLIAPVVAGVLLLGCGAAPEPSQRPEPGTVQVTVTLPAATPATSCRGSEQRAIPALGSVISLSVLERERTAMDVLPDVTGGGYAWLPATTVLPGESRRVGSGRFGAAVYLLPTLGVRTDRRCEPDPSRSHGPGVCLIAGSDRDLRTRCFANEAIWSGRAVALTGGAGEIHGIAPEGVERVRVASAIASDDATLVGNLYEAQLPGVDVADPVTLTFVAPGQPRPCAPSPALQRAVPALGAEPPSDPPPEQLAAVVGVDPPLAARWARTWNSGTELTYWVVPQLHCGVVTENDQACIAVAAEFVEGATCASESDIAERGVSDWYPIGGRPVIAGFAPREAIAARVSVPGSAPQVFPVRDGVFAGALPEGVRMDHPDAYSLTFVR